MAKKSKKILNIILIGILFCFSANYVFSVEEDEHDEFFRAVEVKNGSILSIKNCVALAFQNSPKIRRKKYELDMAKSNVGIAKSAYFPVIGAGVGLNFERNSNDVYYDKRYRDLPVVGVSVNKMVWDFGKTTDNIKMEEFFKIGAEYEFMDELCHTLFDVKAKYYNLLKAQALLNAAENNIKINENFVKISKGEPDLSAAKVNLQEAKIKYIEAENNFNNVKYDLSNSMYLENQSDYKIENTPTFTYNDNLLYGKSQKVEVKPFEPFVFPFKEENAVNIAYENSPDLKVLENTKKAMEHSLKYIKKEYFPELNAGVGYNFNNTNFATNNNLTVGVNLSSQANLMELKHKIKGADAQLAVADNEINLFKKDLYYEVKRALNNVERAKKQVPAAKEEVEQAIITLKTAENGYIGKKLNYIALQEAGKDYIKALNTYIESVYNYNMALIQTEMAMHCHLIDIHHKSQHAMHHHSEELIRHLNNALECNKKEKHKNK